MNHQDFRPARRRRQVDEENFVESTLADELRRQLVDLVGRRDHEDLPVALGHPRQEAAEHSPGSAAVIVTRGEAFLDLVQP